MTDHRLGVGNWSTRVSQSAFHIMLLAIHHQLRAHFLPAWMATSRDIHLLASPEKGSGIGIFDSPEQRMTLLGRRTAPDLRSIYVRDLDREGPWSVSATLSAEVLNSHLDPECDTWFRRCSSREYAADATAPVSGTCYPLVVKGIPVSVANFITPDWYSDEPPTDRYDYLRVLNEPFTLDRRGGGFLLVRHGARRAISKYQVVRSATLRHNWWRDQHSENLTSRTRKRIPGALLF